MTDNAFSDLARDLHELARGSGVALVLVRRTDSTNRLGRHILDELAEDELGLQPTLLLAFEQTAGRGRHGRSWESAPGKGVWASLLVRVGKGRERLQRLPLLSAVGLAQGVESLSGEVCRLKWPNDLLLGDRKVGGILVETVSHQAGTDAIVGFGINVSQTPGELPSAGATSLVGAGKSRPPALAEAAWALTAALRDELGHLDHPAEAVARYRERSVHQSGDRLVCRLANRTVEGIFAGFTDDGFLRLRVGDGEEVLSAGEVVT